MNYSRTFDTEKSGLNQEQGVVNDQIKRLKERKEYYAYPAKDRKNAPRDMPMSKF